MGREQSDAYQALMGRAPRRIPNWEPLANPYFEELVTGIDPWQKPRSARLKLMEKYKIDLMSVPADDTPLPRPESDIDVVRSSEGDVRSRWDKGSTATWQHGKHFHSIDDVLAYEPLKHLDLRDETSIVENRDYSVDDETLFREYAEKKQREFAARPSEPPVRVGGFYNTLFMWLLLTFDWELFLELAAAHTEQLKRLLADFAVINRRVFGVLARLDIDAVLCHDDICMAAGPVCSPQWLRTYIYPYYEEFFDILHRGGKKVFWMSDGNIDKVADDVIACGADHLSSEPYTNWKAIVSKHPHTGVSGEGDNRVLMKGRKETEQMVRSMVETAQSCGGYFMRVGNCIPHNLPPENVKIYFDLCAELAYRA